MIYFGEVLVGRRFCDAIKKLLLTSYFTKRRIMLKNSYFYFYWGLEGYYLSTKSLSPSDGIFTKSLSVKNSTF